MRPAQRWILVVVATLTMAVSYFDRQVLAALAPTVKTNLAISNEQYGWLISAFSIAYLVASPFSGSLIDRIGARRGLIGAVLAWTAIAALHALVPSFGVLFLLRIGLGLAESPSFPGAAQTVQRALPAESRARGFGILFTGGSIGAAIAPLAASVVQHAWGWRSAFLVTALAGLSWVPLWWAVTRKRETRALLGPSDAPALSSAVDLGAVGKALRDPAILRAAVLVIAAAPAVGFGLNWSSSLLHDRYGIAQGDVGTYMFLPPLMFDLGSLAFGYLASTRLGRGHDSGPPRALIAIATLIALTLALASRASGPWTAVIFLGIGLFGAGAIFATLTADMLSRVAPTQISAASGIAASAQSLAYLVANPIIGRVRDATGGYGHQIVALAAIMVPGAIVWIAWKPPPRTLATSAS